MLKIKLLTFALVAFTFVTQAKTNLDYLPSDAQWREHANYIAKYYLHPDAKGVPEGNFPTWRCDDGTLRNQKLCPFERDVGEMIKITGIDWIRMQSRQTFAYGVFYQLTGNSEALRLHKAGVNFLLTKGLDPEGGFHSLMEKGEPLTWPVETGFTDSRLARTSQDLSYALVGLAMNAYLTHDPKVIKVIMDTQKYIYDTYYDKDKGFLRWNFVDTYFDKKDQVELVAMLDQLNAYLLMVWRLVPEVSRPEWTATIRKTIDDMNKNFYDKPTNHFWGCTHNKSCYDQNNGRHQDYGHRVKAFWMEYIAALGLGNSKLANFAKKGMLDTLKLASTRNNNDWYGDNLQRGADYWHYAELDQSALTLALSDDFDMADTLRPWINEYTDKEYGDLKNWSFKSFYWRNGFHNSEHSLIGTILSNAIRAKQCSDAKCKSKNSTYLYFAPVDDKDRNFTPYYYSGKIVKTEKTKDGLKVFFEDIDLPKKVK